MDEVCNQLYNFYRSREIELQRFTLQFLPTLIYIYLNSAAHGDIKVRLCTFIENDNVTIDNNVLLAYLLFMSFVSHVLSCHDI